MPTPTSQLQARAQEVDEQQRLKDEEFARLTAAQDLVRSKNLSSEVSVYRASISQEDGEVTLTLQTGRDQFDRVTVPPEDLSYYTNRYNYYETQARQNRNELQGMRDYYSTVLQSSNTKPVQAAAIENLWKTGDLQQVKTSQDKIYDDWRGHVKELEDPNSRANLYRSGLITDRVFGDRGPARPAYDKPFDRFLEQERLDNVAKVNEVVKLMGGVPDISADNEQLKGTVVRQSFGRLFVENTNESIRNAIAANVGKASSSATTTNVDENAFGSSDGERSRNIADNAAEILNRGIAQFSRNDEFNRTTVVADANAKPERNSPIRSNPLENSTSYTYAFTIFVLTKDEVNQLAENAGVFQPRTVIISTGGRYNSVEPTVINKAYENLDKPVIRAREWTDDFFIDDLKILQLLAPNSQGRTSNTMDIEFTLIEPYGLSLLDRLISTASRLKEKTYTHLCYLLQIDFYDESGLLSEHSKRLPMQFTNMNIKVSSKGTEYRVTALPFSHQAMLDSYGSTPANFEVSGSTLRDFFKDDQPNDRDRATLQTGLTTIRRELEGDTGLSSSYTGVRQVSSDQLAEGIRSNTYKVNSYVAAFNGFNAMLHNLNIKDKKIPPSRIRVRFHDDIIAKEKITQPSKDTTVANNPTINAATYNPGTNVNPNNEAKNWVMSAGTSVVEVINQAMMNSDYIRSQVLLAKKGEENKEAQKEGIVNWWRVLPSVKIIGYDESTQRWSFETTFFVLPYKVYNTRHRHLPMSKVTKAQCVKEYNYLYTGQNTSVIDFQVEFNMLYLTIASGMLENNINDPLRDRAGSADTAEASQPALDNRNGTYWTANRETKVQSFPVATHVVTENRPELTNKGLERDPVAAALAAIADSIYTKSTGDMLNATLKIIGDPHLIKQDDVYFNPSMFYKENDRDASKGTDGIKLPTEWSPTADVSRALANNSLIMDAGHVLAYVEIRNPSDIDEATGGLRKYRDAGDYSAFTGVFFIYEVTSEFKNGAFTQTLELIRYQQQESDIVYAGTERRGDSSASLQDELQRQVSESDLSGPPDANFNNSALVTFPIIETNEDVA